VPPAALIVLIVALIWSVLRMDSFVVGRKDSVLQVVNNAGRMGAVLLQDSSVVVVGPVVTQLITSFAVAISLL
jgi:hypothetical protein